MPYVAGEVMAMGEPFLEQGIHPSIIIQAYRLALDDIINWATVKYRYLGRVYDDVCLCFSLYTA